MECRFMNLTRRGSIRKPIRSDVHTGSLLCEGKTISKKKKTPKKNKKTKNKHLTGFNLMNNVTGLAGLGPD